MFQGELFTDVTSSNCFLCDFVPSSTVSLLSLNIQALIDYDLIFPQRKKRAEQTVYL